MLHNKIIQLQAIIICYSNPLRAPPLHYLNILATASTDINTYKYKPSSDCLLACVWSIRCHWIWTCTLLQECGWKHGYRELGLPYIKYLIKVLWGRDYGLWRNFCLFAINFHSRQLCPRHPNFFIRITYPSFRSDRFLECRSLWKVVCISTRWVVDSISPNIHLRMEIIRTWV